MQRRYFDTAEMRITTQTLYQAACWKHAKAQQPWDRERVNFYAGFANGLALALTAQGLTDRQLRQLEDDAVALGPSGRWDGLIEGLDVPDGTVPHED